MGWAVWRCCHEVNQENNYLRRFRGFFTGLENYFYCSCLRWFCYVHNDEKHCIHHGYVTLTRYASLAL